MHVLRWFLFLFLPAEDRTLWGAGFSVSFESDFSELEQVR